MGFLSVVIAVIGLAFAAEAMGLLTHELNLALAVLCLLICAAMAPSSRENAGPADRRLVYGGGALATFGLVLLAAHWDLRFFAAALWFSGLETVARGRGERRTPAAVLAIGCVIFGIYQWGYGNSPLLWYAAQGVSRTISSVTSRLSGQTVALGPTFSGLGALVMVTGIGCAGLVFKPPKSDWPGRCLLTVVASVVLYAGYLVGFALLPLASSAAGSEEDAGLPIRALAALADRFYPVHLPALLSILLALPLGFLLGGFTADRVITARGRPGWLLASAAIAIAAVSLMTNLPATAPDGIKVSFYEKGFVNWASPNRDRYGSRSAGMFGNLPRLAEAMGGESEMIAEITDETLSGSDVMVIINQNVALPADSIEAVERFVEAGGGLLVLGDHTFWKSEKRMLLDEPLEQTNIRYKFDSADFFVGGWLHSMQYWPHRITIGMGDAINEAGSVVGASLEIGYPATPILIGRFGYSDPGVTEASARGYLGNLDFDPGEPLGDVVLTAAENVGRGRVVVVGDTSGFVNSIMFYSWPYVHRIFSWLGGTGRATIPMWRDALGLMLAGLAIVVVLVRASRNPWCVPVTAVALLVAGSLSHRAVATLGRPAPLSGDVAVVDLSHVGRHSMEGWRNEAIDGVYLNLMRNGYLVLGMREFDVDVVQASDLLVSIAPTHPYSRSERRALRDFMEDGGTVLVTAGWEDRAGSEALLDAFDLELAHRPLGRIDGSIPAAAVSPMFWEAWPVRGGETLVTSRGEPVVVTKKVGRGQMIVVGDSEFWHNKNLEVEGGAIARNTQFFDWLMTRIKDGGES